MPNWCENYFEFRVPTSSSKRFTNFVDAFNSKQDYFNHGLLQLLCPMPEHQPDVDKPNAFYALGGIGKDEEIIYGKNNWYDWSIQNWGTKWDLDLESITYNVDGDYVYFKGNAFSAWSPPFQAFLNSSFEFSLYYAEPSMNFFGYADLHGDSTYECPLNLEDFNKYLDFSKAFKDWLIKSDLPNDFFQKLDVPALFGGYEPENKPNWLDGLYN
jgi:hypothetical protein